MSEVKWIKLATDMFDDEKIKIIQSLPEGNSILVIWVRLIILAGKTNNGGYIYINENLPYTEEMLSTIFNQPLVNVKLAIQTFEQFGMIECNDLGMYLVNFEKHQNIEGLEKIREQTKKRVAKHREKQRLLKDENVTLHVTQCNATDKNKNKNKNIYNNMSSNDDSLVELYNEICTNLPTIKKITNKRKTAINKFKKTFNEEEIKQIFTIANSSEFLIGKNDRNWKADFDFLLRTDKATAILEGKYSKDTEIKPKTETKNLIPDTRTEEEYFREVFGNV